MEIFAPFERTKNSFGTCSEGCGESNDQRYALSERHGDASPIVVNDNKHCSKSLHVLPLGSPSSLPAGKYQLLVHPSESIAEVFREALCD